MCWGDEDAYRDVRLAAVETEDGNLRAAPLEEQSEPMRALLEKGVDERTIELLRAMFEQHGQGEQAPLRAEPAGQTDHPAAEAAPSSCSTTPSRWIRDYQTVEFTPKGLERFHLFLHDQARVRADLLEPVVSPACRETFPKH